MSTILDTIVDDAPLTEGSPQRPGRPRHIWVTDVIAPDPHRPGYLYLSQHVDGTWVEASDYADSGVVIWEKRFEDDPVITRIAYMSMDEQGNLINVHAKARAQNGR